MTEDNRQSSKSRKDNHTRISVQVRNPLHARLRRQSFDTHKTLETLVSESIELLMQSYEAGSNLQAVVAGLDHEALPTPSLEDILRGILGDYFDRVESIRVAKGLTWEQVISRGVKAWLVKVQETNPT